MLESFLGLGNGSVRDWAFQFGTEDVGVGADPYFSESDMKVNDTSASTVSKLLA